ncbi:hypothetical protein PR003_g24730 [Phytophthora rubi]|nr:hypothetical protein PR002_g24270 [Phytophthora rubi]KAE9292534.1 hypothetical protein PR003_g24730 [Phytophthora rubi]
MSIGEYKEKAHGKGIYVRDELDFLVEYGSVVDMEEGEEDKEAFSPRRK